MSITVALNHKTHYKYDRKVALSPHVFRLRPAAHSRTQIQAYTLNIIPKNHFISWQQDPFGNYLARVVFPEKTDEFSFEVDVIAQLLAINPFDFFVEEYAEEYPFAYEPQLKKELTPYFECEDNSPELLAWLKPFREHKGNTVSFLVSLNSALQKHIAYTIRLEAGVQSCAETLTKKTGSCRDSAWVLVQALRHLGLAARFVSGYLVQLASDVASLDGPSGPAEDFTDLHAWVEAYVPGAGWIGLDPTSGIFAGEGHIPLACTAHYKSAAPVTGGTDECEVEFSFSNSVTRIHEDPRVTKPYSEQQWQAIDQLGDYVDGLLQKYDTRLTMGGEPTFVSIDDMEADEWNTTADGPHKRKLAEDLLLRLQTQFAPGGFRHYGQGKWYPGEPLPRWQRACYWRRDQQPIWQDAALQASLEKDYGAKLEHATAFINALSSILGLDASYIKPAYEDGLYFLWLEGNQPASLDPTKAHLKDSRERQKLAQVLNADLGKAVGYVLPLAWDLSLQGWRSSRWQLRREHLFLIPGDSAMGLRLPLERVYGQAPKPEEALQPRDLFETVVPLPSSFSQPASLSANTKELKEPIKKPTAKAGPEKKSNTSENVLTALAVEPRDGKLFIFMPPLAYLEHYLSLLAAIEQCAKAINMPVLIEGYGPPADNRLSKFAVTPDPGVIEVNIHPAADWQGLKDITHTLYAEARLARLGTEKFMLDGRHSGTGGGNHVTLGGATPADSPMLRRPDVLRSLITYWQHHPGLSYLFSGLFIGPTSQAPRVDEGRHEYLYELETAFSQIPKGEVPQPWLVDRLLRHLLVDITGNTHRSEFCIDKLYSPDSATGRMGLVEFRAFEMPPHPRMSLVQMLLLRTLVARFWQQPYHHPLVRWGTELHDRFLLPHYVWADIQDITEDLKQAGFDFKAEWLFPFLEFRFPVYGRRQIKDISIELRTAIEPWHVLGEEVSSSGTSRFVDSSIERLQVKVSGLTDSRYILSCNGYRLPLMNTGVQGEYVAGVRFRAWQPPSALHPMIPVHSPLVIDLIDTWSGRAVGGCTYHVSHPGGRHFETFPVNSLEAEGRRLARFWDIGYTPGNLAAQFSGLSSAGYFTAQGSTPGPIAPPEDIIEPEYPHTLDLRRVNI
ncbi:transglutaminase family protein [Dasania sp. GY-MA-18]|uniref:Transglutaminase family protein n=1 Tax=Dasania phycosphaerae TaxID=2950436 RepID=A0A9J6RPA5_9GAMM|nr:MULTISPECIES: transglutaminase family protein [Dasania]MCR8923420.1 transglutaminase family protein [Dasania sp. GY-MA-18]MCZ0865853.1 transglutaminase family protein [Dasania phycosphaerae]MCZ0869577.1 transglutaminase family protein [Dasania phycosphaerae]